MRHLEMLNFWQSQARPRFVSITRLLIVALLLLATQRESSASQHLLFQNTENGKTVYWKLETTGLLKNTTRDDGWGYLSDWAPAVAWRVAAIQRNADASNRSHLIWRNTTNGKVMYWVLGSDGKLLNRTKNDGWGMVAERTAPLPWRLVNLQYNADNQGNAHLILFNNNNGKTVYWKLDSTGKLKNETKGDGWNLISADWMLPSPWNLVDIQANADHAGNDHLLWQNTSNGKTRYWKLDSTGVLKNRTKGDGWDALSTWELPTNWRMAGVQTNADKQGFDHVLFHNPVTGKAVYWKLNASGSLKNRTQGDGWDFISETKALSPWVLAAIQANADGQNGDNILWRNQSNGKLMYWKLASTGKIKNTTKNDGWGPVSDWQIATSWRVLGVDAASGYKSILRLKNVRCSYAV